MQPNLHQIAKALGGDVSGGQVLCPGPGHSRNDRSLAVRFDPAAPDGFVVFSHAGDDSITCRDHVRSTCGLEPFKPGNINGADTRISHSRNRGSEDSLKSQEICPAPPSAVSVPIQHDELRRHVYLTPDGIEAVVKIKRAGGKFVQWFNVDGQWQPEKPKRSPWPALPYTTKGLNPFDPELASDELYWPEGEKDVETLDGLNLPAFTFGGVSDPLPDDLEQYVRGRRIVVLADNDREQRGLKHAQKKAERTAVAGAAAIKIVSFAEKDVSDFIAAGRSDEDLRRHCDAVEWSKAPAEQSDATDHSIKPNGDKSATVVVSLPPLQWLDMSKLDREPVPERQWAIRDRVPLRQVGLFSGEGGGGKSIIELTKNVAHVAAKDWFGSLPEPGPALYLGAEDDADEIHIRLAAIAKHYGTNFAELIKGGLHILCLLGQDATLCAVSRGGKVETTPLYRQIYEAAGDIKPKNISVDTLSRAFAGNEIDRVQVYAFAMHMQALAMVANGSVTVLSHPSLQGISSGSGISGSTAWHGAFRFRQYLTSAKPAEGEQPESDLRELQFKKNQYGPLGESIVLRYRNGLFLPEAGMSSLDRVAKDAKADETFLRLIEQFAEDGRHVSYSRTANNYAPTVFAQEATAKDLHLRKADIEAAMRRLFDAKKIHVETYGPPSKRWQRLAIRDAK
jgi:RecA-family ATPase